MAMVDSNIPQTICLFIPTGRTFTFRGTRIVFDNETVLVFEYQAMSDGKMKMMTVQKNQIVGFSISYGGA